MTGRVRVIHCVGWISRGGVEQRRVVLAESHDLTEFEHILICQVAKPPLLDRLTDAGWKVFEIGTARHPLDLSWYLRCLSIARRHPPDLIHGAVYEGNLLGTFLRLMFRKSKLIIEETSDFRGRRKSGDWLFMLMALRADRVVGVAPEIANALERRLRFLAKRVRLVVNGVEPHTPIAQREKNRIRNQYSIKRGDLVVGSVGRLLDSHKKFSDLIQVVAQLSQSFPHLKLLIVGDGSDREALEAQSRESGLEGRVIFAGYHERPRKFLELFDLFVLPSSGEALPLALIEAMHAGIPCVATRVGGNPYVLDNGAAGALFSPGDLDQLQIEVRALLESESLRSDVGNKGRNRALEYFSASRYVTDVLNLWDELLGTQ